MQREVHPGSERASTSMGMGPMEGNREVWDREQ